MSDVERIQCPKCAEEGRDNHEDNFIVYLTATPPNADCKSCGYHDSNFDLKAHGLTAKKKTIRPLIDKGEFHPIKSRGISKRICEMYNYSVSKDAFGKYVQVVNFTNPKTRQIVAQKIRTQDKKFYWVGDKTKVNQLFGQSLFEPNPKLSITVTEGELDCLSYAEATQGKWPCVSIRNGAGGSAKELTENAEWLKGFKKIIILFDGDEAGREAAASITQAASFADANILIAQLPDGEDVNSLVLAGKFDVVNKACVRAASAKVENIVKIEDYTSDEIFAPDPMGVELPFPILSKKIGGLKSSRLYLVVAGSGVGKSTFIKELAYDLAVNKKLTVGNLYLEQGELECMKDFVAIDNNIEVETFNQNPDMLPNTVRDASLAKLNEHMYFYKHFGSLESDLLLSKIEYMMNALDCDVVILDHITMVTSGMSAVDNERREIDILMTKFRSIIQRTGKSMIVVSHLSRKAGESYNEGATVSTNNIKGSSGLEQISDFIIALEKNMDIQHTVKLKLLKYRRLGGGKEVQAGEYADLVRYDLATGRLLSVGQAQPPTTYKKEQSDDSYF